MNKTIRAVIIEDEVPASRLLVSMVRDLRPDWSVEALEGTISQAVAWFAANDDPDIIFLDIELADGNSFELLSSVRPRSAIIFTTAYDEYAIRAFGVNSVDYILKPIDSARLSDAIEKFEGFRFGGSLDSGVLGSDSRLSSSYLDDILESLSSRTKRYRTRFLIQGHDSMRTLSVDSVAYFYSENKVTFAVLTTGEQCVIDFSLERLVEQLDPDQFFRANRQTIISIGSVKRIEPSFNGKVIVFVTPAAREKITISRERISSLKVWLNY